MKILLTGSDGYIGSVAGQILIAGGHEVHGLDTGFFRNRNLARWQALERNLAVRDVRDVGPEHLSEFDAVVHMGELSNDPLGELSGQTTRRVNEMGSIRLARVAREAGVSRFVYMSSCSVYGGNGGEWCTEQSAPQPLTTYARCKVAVESAIQELASTEFTTVALRNATAYGMSAGLRLDLVVNDMCAQAITRGEVALQTDGSQWRPLVEVRDIARAVLVVLDAPADAVQGEVFNVGCDTQNFTIRDVADTIAKAACVPLRVGDHVVPDVRSYRVSFAKAREVLDFTPDHSLVESVPQLLGQLASDGLNSEDIASGRFIRLRSLVDLIQSGQLDADLRWSTC